MSPPEDSLPRGIGSGLKEARRRLGMDVKEAEDRTKIRARYLRALEAEDWEVLPAPAYVRGFLRTYGDLLGLDGEMLADEFRRRHEAPPGAASPAAEPALRERRRPSGARRAPGARPPSRGPLIAAIATGILVLVLVLSLLGGGGDDPAPVDPDAPAKESTKADGKPGKRSAAREGKAKLVPVGLSVKTIDAMQICLVADSEALIDAQVLAAGATEEFDDFKRYRIDVEGGGALRVAVDGRSEQLESDEPASYEADSAGIRMIDYAGPDCP